MKFTYPRHNKSMTSMLPKAEKALDVTVKILYTSRYSRQQESLQNLIKNALYSFPLKEIGVLHKGKLFFKGKSSSRTDIFLDYVYKKAGGDIGKLEEEFSRLAGMAENIFVSREVLTIEKFEAGWKTLQEAIIEGKITAENAIDFIDEARIYFNHKVIINAKGEKEIAQIGSNNCVEVVKVVEEFFRTGKINTASFSEAQQYRELEKFYNGRFDTYGLGTLRTKEEIMPIGTRGILLCERGPGLKSHVLNITKIEKR